MLILFLMNLAVGYNSFLLVRYFFKLDNRLDYFSSIFILYFTQIVFTLELLGIFSKLTLMNVLLLNSLLLIITFGVIKSFRITPKLKFSLKSSSDNIGLNIDSKIIKLCLAVLLGFGVVKIIVNLFNPPFGWDNLNYHFTFPVEWLKNHNLQNNISISGDPSVSYYPINGSLFFLWFMLPLRNVFLADLGQLPFFICTFLIVIALARKLHVSKEFSFYAAALFSLIPNYFKQLQIAYIDIIVACLFLAALNYLFLIKKEGRISNFILCSLAIGLNIGTKTTVMPTALLLLLPLILFCFTKNQGHKIIVAILVCLIMIVLSGGFSYIKSFALTHNPLYPLNFKFAGYTIFKGVIDNQFYRVNIRPGDLRLAKFLFHEGLGGQTLLFVLPSIVLASPLLFFKKIKEHDFLMSYLAILPFLIILVFRFIIPLANIRYIYALFAITIIIYFYTLELFKVPKKIIKTLIVLCVIASMAELAKKYELIFGIILTLIMFFSINFLISFVKNKLNWKSFVAGFLILFITLSTIERNYIGHEFSRYIKMIKYSGFWPDATKAWAWLNDNTHADNIAYIGRPVPFPLYGTNFKNNVYYVSVNKVEPAMLHYFKNSKYIFGYKNNEVLRNFEDSDNYRGNADYTVWLRNLKNKNTGYLFIYSDLLGRGIEFPLEDAWAREHAELFKLVFSNQTIRIYKIING